MSLLQRKSRFETIISQSLGGMCFEKSMLIDNSFFLETTCSLWKSVGLGAIFSRLATINSNGCTRSELRSRT